MRDGRESLATNLPVGSAPDKLYRGWKEIAERLRVSEDTAQRMARDHGLPVIRGGGVYLYESALVAWENGRVDDAAAPDDQEGRKRGMQENGEATKDDKGAVVNGKKAARPRRRGKK